MLAVTGYNSRLVQELRHLLPEGEEVVRIGYDDAEFLIPLVPGMPIIEFYDCDRYLFCAGVLRPKKLTEQATDEIAETMLVNCIYPMQLADRILEHNAAARICIVGSESGYTWSYDGAYAAAKTALHRYVETKNLGPRQQLIAVAPSIIEDAGMTTRRTDFDNLKRRRAEHPKKRFLKAVEVARLIHFVLYQDEGYLSGTVIRMNGGV